MAQDIEYRCLGLAPLSLTSKAFPKLILIHQVDGFQTTNIYFSEMSKFGTLMERQWQRVLRTMRMTDPPSYSFLG